MRIQLTLTPALRATGLPIWERGRGERTTSEKATRLQTPMSTVYLALGTNLGDRRANLGAAVVRLQTFLQIDHISSLYETAPAYVADQPRFLNAALRATTTLEPEALLDALKQIERELGRTTGLRNGPRLIDLDLLLYGDLVLATTRLTLPHPRLSERPFVLVPLAEIAPTLRLPGFTQTVSELAAHVHGNGDVLANMGTLDDTSRNQEPVSTSRNQEPVS